MVYVRLGLFLKNNWKEICYLLFGIFGVLLIIPLFTSSSLLPDADEEDIQRYTEVAGNLGIDWKELAVLDMVLFDHDLKGRDPNESAKYFISLYYEEFTPASQKCIKTDADNECLEYEQIPEKVTYSNEIKGKNKISEFLKNQGYSGTDIYENIMDINSKEGKRVTVTPVAAEEAMNNAGFDENMKDHFNQIIQSGILDELFPEYANIGVIPGSCIANISVEGKAKVNSVIQGYTGLILKYAEKYGIGQYTEVIKAMMMAETGGVGNDPLQASEGKYGNLSASCIGKTGAARVGCITNPDDSIHAGVQEFRDRLKLSGYDIPVAIQAYNFGDYFATWIKSHGGVYTVEIAQTYSNTVMKKAGQGLGTPTHAKKVLGYYNDPGCTTADGEPSVYGDNDWAWPTKSTRLTSNFGPRVRPCSTCSANHPALDIGAIKAGVAGDPVWAMDDGVVISSGLATGGGHTVYVDHGKSVVSRYMHLNSRKVTSGQKVKKGQIVGLMGGSGGTKTQVIMNAYAIHLDFQIRINGVPVDPAKFFPGVKRYAQ